jgi:hypothetical protein
MIVSSITPFGNQLVDRTDEIKVIMDGKKYIPPFRLKDHNTFLGIEVEVERVFRERGVLSVNDNFYLWDNIADGSLRNNGREFVSIPLRGDSVSFAISELHKILSTEKTCIGHEFTDRTSVHVHMNVRDMEIKDLKNLILTYLVVEPLMYAFVGGDRAKNIFCVPITQSHLTYQLGQIMEVGERDFVAYTRNWYKYTGLNLLPIGKYGTIEFRHMVGTTNEEFLNKWLNMILSLKQYSNSVSLEKNKERILGLNTNSEYFNFLREVFGNDVDLGDIPNVENILEQTSIFIKDVFTVKDNTYKTLLTKPEIKSAELKAKELPFFNNAVARNLVKFIDIQYEIEKRQKELVKVRETIIKFDKTIAKYRTAMKEDKANSIAYKHAIANEEESKQRYVNKAKMLEEIIANLKDGVVSEKKPKKSLDMDWFDAAIQGGGFGQAGVGLGDVVVNNRNIPPPRVRNIEPNMFVADDLEAPHPAPNLADWIDPRVRIHAGNGLVQRLQNEQQANVQWQPELNQPDLEEDF